MVIICSNKCKIKNDKAYFFKTDRLRDLLSKISSKFYKLKPNNIFAVTGTNGKTSVADYFINFIS